MTYEERAKPVDTRGGVRHRAIAGKTMKVKDLVKHVLVKEMIAQLLNKKWLAIDNTLAARRWLAYALEYLETAIVNGETKSYYFAGKCLALARTHSRDFSDCYTIWEIGSDFGDPSCDYALGCSLYFGIGTERDIPKSMDAFKRAANAGIKAAIPFLYFSYLNGDRGQVDIECANKWKQKYPPEWPMQRGFSPWKRWWLVHDGKVLSIAEFSRVTGIGTTCVNYRLLHGASLDRIGIKFGGIGLSGIVVNGELMSAYEIGRIAGISTSAVYLRKKHGDLDILRKKETGKLYEYKGKKIPMSKLSRILKMDRERVRCFFAKGFSIDEIKNDKCYKVNESCWGWMIKAWGGKVKPLAMWLEERKICRDEFISEMRGKFNKLNLRSALYRIVRKRSLEAQKAMSDEKYVG